MENSVFILLSSLVFDIYVVRKIVKKSTLTLFDIILVFYTLYFVLIPIKCILTGSYYRGVPIADIVGASITPPIYIFLIKAIICSVSVIFSKDKKKCNYLYVDNYFKVADVFFHPPIQSVYLYILFFIMALRPMINYSALSSENVEGNLTYFYGQNMPFYERLFANMLIGALPVFVVLSVKYFLDIKKRMYKRLSYINMVLVVVCVLLSGRTNCFNIIVLITLFLYSCKTSIFTIKNIVASICLFSIIGLVYFPVYQSFRMTKNIVISNSSNHDFGDVVKHFVSLSPRKAHYLYSKATQSVDSRSFNVYMAFHEACTKNYQSTAGNYTIENFMCLNPFHKPDFRKDNIYAKLLEGGGDIAESLPTILYADLNADIGFLFIFIIPLFYLIYFYLLWVICRIANLIFKTQAISFLLISMIVMRCMTVEGGIHIRDAYNPGIIVIFMFSLFMIINKKISKKIMYI